MFCCGLWVYAADLFSVFWTRHRVSLGRHLAQLLEEVLMHLLVWSHRRFRMRITLAVTRFVEVCYCRRIHWSCSLALATILMDELVVFAFHGWMETLVTHLVDVCSSATFLVAAHMRGSRLVAWPSHFNRALVFYDIVFGALTRRARVYVVQD